MVQRKKNGTTFLKQNCFKKKSWVCPSLSVNVWVCLCVWTMYCCLLYMMGGFKDVENHVKMNSLNRKDLYLTLGYLSTCHQCFRPPPLLMHPTYPCPHASFIFFSIFSSYIHPSYSAPFSLLIYILHILLHILLFSISSFIFFSIFSFYIHLSYSAPSSLLLYILHNLLQILLFSISIYLSIYLYTYLSIYLSI